MALVELLTDAVGTVRLTILRMVLLSLVGALALVVVFRHVSIVWLIVNGLRASPPSPTLAHFITFHAQKMITYSQQYLNSQATQNMPNRTPRNMVG